MEYSQHGPRGAEDERRDFWTGLAEGADALPGVLPVPDLDPDAAGEIADPDSQASPQDPLGSWTGVPDIGTADAGELPTQDQDDL